LAYLTLGTDFIDIWRERPVVRYAALGLAVWVGVGVGALVFEGVRLGFGLRR
jgi:hypothetical protein